MFWIQLDILVLAVHSRGEELGAELKQVGAYLAAGEGERVESVEIDVRSNRGDDPANETKPSQILVRRRWHNRGG
jgi:hypothetical protein